MTVKSNFLGVVCFMVLCITLSLGLWPFHAPRNSVRWLTRANGIELGENGTVLGSNSLQVVGSSGAASIEIWVQPDRWASSTLLALYNREYKLLFTLRQSLTDLELSAEVQNGPRPVKSHFLIDETFGPALRQKKSVFLTVTSGQHGIMVYVDGDLTKVSPGFRIPESALSGRLILGDSFGQPDSFRGQIRGLGIYQAELSPEEVLRHFQSWTVKGTPDVIPKEHNIASYLFDEHQGWTIHNRAGANSDLSIPETYHVVDKIFMEPFWKEFDFSGSYWRGNLKNIIGFIPAGFCFYAYFMSVRRVKRPMLVTLATGAFVSITIEVLQGFLPTRDSGTTDIITNIFGTYLGVLFYHKVYLSWPGSRAAPQNPLLNL